MQPAIDTAIRKAMSDIENRGFDGTDYRAGVEGVYSVKKSASDDTVVGYLVYGTGSGEPDYQDAMIMGIDLKGKRVFDEEESG